ncbi:hypothetical protein ACOSP7_010089 [Xanthoceras sorbifolium]
MELRSFTHQNVLCNNINEDAITKIFGQEKLGRVRGLGFGDNPSRIDAQIQYGEMVKQLEAKLKITNAEVARLRNMMDAIMKQNEKLINRSAMEDAEGSHAYTHSHECTPHIYNSQLENTRCHFLHRYPNDDIGDQVVVEEKIHLRIPRSNSQNTSWKRLLEDLGWIWYLKV